MREKLIWLERLIYTEIHASGGKPRRARRGSVAIVWLLSDEAPYITGACLDVTGGR